jgi:hypothetical protein
MIDTFTPMSLGPVATSIADPDYYTSWATHPARQG